MKETQTNKKLKFLSFFVFISVIIITIIIITSDITVVSPVFLLQNQLQYIRTVKIA